MGYSYDVPADDLVAERFRPYPEAVTRARRFLRQALAGIPAGSVDDDLLHTLIMAANELAANAVLHARTDFIVRVLADARRVRIEVSDSNTRMPQPCLTPRDAASGRGLGALL